MYETPITYRPDIDGLRAIAVLAVVLFHAHPGLLPGGFVGVNVFFVISGFLISSIIIKGVQQGSFSYTQFYIKRIKRIFPALLTVLLTVCIVGWYLLFKNEYINLGKHLFGSATFLSNFFLWQESGYFDNAMEAKPLMHLWSLAIEEQFYLIWPFILFFAYKKNWNALLCILAITILSFAFNVWSINRYPEATFFLPLTRFWELLAGGLLAYITIYKNNYFEQIIARMQIRIPHITPTVVNNILAFSGLALLIFGIAEIDKDKSFPGWWALFPILGTYLLIAAGPNALINRYILANRYLVYIGLISYPLYLWHWPLLSFKYLITRGEDHPVLTVSAVVLAFVLAWLTYIFIEKPIRFKHHRERKSAGVLLLLLFGIGIIGAVNYTGVIKSRLDTPAFNKIISAVDDWEYPGKKGLVDNKLVPQVIKGAADQTVLFIGDSHIEQYWPRVNEIIDPQNPFSKSAVFISYGGCPPLPEVNRMQPWFKCDLFFQLALQEAQSKNVDTVVFGGFWEQYFGLTYETKETIADIYNTADSDKTRLRINTPQAEKTFTAFAETISQLQNSGKKVFIILSNPSAPVYDPMQMVPRLSMNISEPSDLDKIKYVEYISPVINKIKAIAQETGATVIDPIPYLCVDSTCPTTTPDGMPVYKDSNHMRPFYAQKQGKYIDPIFQ